MIKINPKKGKAKIIGSFWMGNHCIIGGTEVIPLVVKKDKSMLRGFGVLCEIPTQGEWVQDTIDIGFLLSARSLRKFDKAVSSGSTNKEVCILIGQILEFTILTNSIDKALDRINFVRES